jgi:hypothetical protein
MVDVLETRLINWRRESVSGSVAKLPIRRVAFIPHDIKYDVGNPATSIADLGTVEMERPFVKIWFVFVAME